MAQLREKQTSEFIFEGTPLECAVVADEIGRDEVLFDGVGEAFDPDAVLKAQSESIDAIQSVIDDGENDADTRKRATASMKEARERESVTKKRSTDAKKALEKARARVG